MYRVSMRMEVGDMGCEKEELVADVGCDGLLFLKLGCGYVGNVRIQWDV